MSRAKDRDRNVPNTVSDDMFLMQDSEGNIWERGWRDGARKGLWEASLLVLGVELKPVVLSFLY